MELKWCPFCGKQPEIMEGYSDWFVGCFNSMCAFQPSERFGSKKLAIKVWNTRIIPPPQDVEEYYKE